MYFFDYKALIENFQASRVQLAGRSRAPRSHSAAAEGPLDGRQPLLEERPRRVSPEQHSDHVLQAAAQPGGVHPRQKRPGGRQRAGPPHAHA